MFVFRWQRTIFVHMIQVVVVLLICPARLFQFKSNTGLIKIDWEINEIDLKGHAVSIIEYEVEVGLGKNQMNGIVKKTKISFEC